MPSESRRRRDDFFALLQTYLQLLTLLLVVWILGYFNFSITWLLFGLFVYLWTDKYKKRKVLQGKIAQEAAQDEKGLIMTRVEDLPSWVYFPDVERAEWLNKIISQLWPFVAEYVNNLLKKTIEPKIKASLPKSLKSFEFTRIDLGDIAPRVGGVKVYTEHVRRNEIIIDMELFYASDADVKIEISRMSAGIKNLQVKGTVRVELKPLVNQMPLIGGISVFFLNKPNIDFNLTNIANAFDIPGISDALHTVIEDQISNYMVLPNRIPIQLSNKVDLAKLRYPQPKGVLRVNVVEARDLKKADISLFGMGKSDAYCKIYVGSNEPRKTKVCPNTLNPYWNEMFEIIVNVQDGQILTLKVLDHDTQNKNDNLGNVSVDIGSVAENGYMDILSLPLEDVSTGSVHLKLTWLHLSAEQASLETSLDQIARLSYSERLSSSFLMVYLDSATHLPMSKAKKMEEPSPFVILSLGNDTQESSRKIDTCKPVWEENFYFLVSNPEVQDINLQVSDSKTKESLGYLSVPLRSLLEEDFMEVDVPFELKDGGPDSRLHLRLCLRILVEGACPNTVIREKYLKAEDTVNSSLSKDTNVNNNKPALNNATNLNETSSPSAVLTDENTENTVNTSPASSSSSDAPSLLRRRISQGSAISQISDQVVQGQDCSLGKIRLTLRYSVQRNRLILVVHKCRQLTMASNVDNMLDPYVRIYLNPNRSHIGKKKTQVIRSNNNPVFDETFEFVINMEDVSQSSLDVAVKNSVSVFSRSKSRLGQVLVELSQYKTLTTAVTQWFYLQYSTDGHNRSPSKHNTS